MRASKLAAGVLAAMTLAGLLFAPQPESEARGRYRIRSSELTTGLTYTRILDRRGPKRIKVLEVDASTALTIDVALAGDRLPGRERTTSMSSRHGALAAINGAVGLPSGRPMGVFVEDADFKATELVWGRAFSMSADEQQTYIGHPKSRIFVHRPTTGETRRVHQWNEGDPQPWEIAGYTVAGGSVARPPEVACSARLFPTGELMWSADTTGFEQDYAVDKVKCADRRLRRGGGTVVSAPLDGGKATFLSALVPGEVVRLSWSLGWALALDAIAGNPTLVENGELVATTCDSYFCRRQPRTGVGVTAEGRVLLVTVDGRQPEWSVGMNLVQFGRLFRRLGATWALNVDGGGSTTMVIDGNVVNRPSDSSGERYVSSAVLVLPGEDAGQPVPAPHSSPSPSPAPTPSPEAASPVSASQVLLSGEQPGPDPSLLDPGSTGGLLDALARGELGPPVRLTGALGHALRLFRVGSPESFGR